MSKRKTVLITGPVKIVSKTLVRESKERFLALGKTFSKDVTVIYPTVLAEPTATWDESIRSDIANLTRCEELHLLHGWQGHKRSEILRNIAISIGIKPIYH